jgi:GGDEF domain-containing protein
VLFPGKTVRESEPHLELLRAGVEGAAFTQRGKDRPKKKPSTPRARGAGARQLAVTVSIGAAQARGAAHPDEVVKAADKALYRAKEGGRNQLAM